MTIKKFVYISGPRMGTNNQKSNGQVLKSGRKRRKAKPKAKRN